MRGAAVLAIVLVVGGCGSSGGSKSVWPGREQNSAGHVKTAAFNDFLAGDGKEFATSPIAAVTEFLRLDQSSASVMSVVATSPGEVRNFSEVVATLDGLLDDSVRTERFTVELQRSPSKLWRVRAADWAQRCRSGRGHQDFSPKPCV
jgi:hypothetical protein